MSSVVRIAVNYSTVASELITSEEVAVDLFKCPTENDLVVAAESVLPVFVHGSLWVGDGDVLEAAINEWATYSRVGATRWLNTHFAPTRASLEDLDPEQRCAVALDRALRDVGLLIERYSARRVAVENVPWETRSDFPIDRVAVDPAPLHALVHRADVGFILDLAHVRLAALELGVDPWTLIDEYPTERLVELHVTGVAEDDNGRRRDSMPMGEEDWALAEEALDRIAAGEWPTPSVVALEYGGEGEHFEWRTNRDALREQLNRLSASLEARALRHARA